MRLSLLVNILVVFAVATTLIGASLFMGLLAVPGGAAVATTRPPSTGPLPTLNPTPSSVPSETPSVAPTVRPTAGGTYVVQPDDTLSTIADLFGVSYLLIAEANQIPPPYTIHVGDELFIPVPESACGDYQMYTVKPGDYLLLIANQYGVDWTDLADFNNLPTEEIHPGDILCIPAPGWTPLPTPAE